MYQSKLGNQEIDHLFEAILTLETLEDCYRFFEDLCTIHELQSLAQRMEVARQLDEKKTYSHIAESTGGLHRDHQPRQPVPGLRRGRLSPRPGPHACRAGRESGR